MQCKPQTSSFPCAALVAYARPGTARVSPQAPRWGPHSHPRRVSRLGAPGPATTRSRAEKGAMGLRARARVG